MISTPRARFGEEAAHADDALAVESYVAVLRDEATTAAGAARARATTRAYEHDWRAFEAFARDLRRTALPAEPETVALYVAALARQRRPTTIARALAAIAVVHGMAGLESPTRHAIVRAVLKGVRRQLGVAQKQKLALRVDALRTIVHALPEDLRSRRDRAVLLLGWSAALRRAEIAALQCADLEFVPNGVLVTVRASKQDQEGAGETIAIAHAIDNALCPVHALRVWLAAIPDDGSVFRRIDRHGNIGSSLSPWAIAAIVKQRGAAIGVDAETLGGHSLRAGFATEAAAAGINERAIMRHGRWRSVTVARRYIRVGSAWSENVSGLL